MIQYKNDSINSIQQHGRVVDNNCCVVFPTSRLPYLILCPTTYFTIRTKNNYKIFEYENLLLLKASQTILMEINFNENT